jgi:hypothetical protein
MRVNAIYHHEVMEDGREVHSVEHDGGGFVVSSQKVGVAIQNFLHYATLTDIDILHKHLFHEYARRYEVTGELQKMDAEAMYKRGVRDGENAASWLIDGNTPDPFMFISKILNGMEDGDPEIMDMLPEPRVGGEWADDPTWEQICVEEIDRYGDDGEQELFAVYTEAFHDGVETQIRKMYNDLSPSKKV